MTEANRAQIGEYHYRKVIEWSGRREPMVLANLAWNLKNQGRMADSRRLYEESAGRARVMLTWLGWARMQEADRNLARAGELLDKAEGLMPDNASINLSRAVCPGRNGAYSQALGSSTRMAPR